MDAKNIQLGMTFIDKATCTVATKLDRNEILISEIRYRMENALGPHFLSIKQHQNST